ncbi:MAG: hypothetical protein HOL70_01720, partial [Candidatus Marinimicrobia bacterium]|nr:hypothetical protein [Candidatus Neomarinimicrobiota bacterium]
FVQSSDNAYLFINGNKYEKGSPVDYSVPEGIFNIGRQASNGSENWNGFIDQIRISNIARYTEDYSDNFEFTFSDDENTIALLNFNEGTGTTLTDQTSNGDNGTIVGATWSEDVPNASSGNDSTFTFNVEAETDGVIGVSIAADAAQDAAGNGNTAPDLYEVVYNGIAPAVPQNLAVEPGDEQVSLSWDANTEQDLDNYYIYGQSGGMETTTLLSFDGDDDYGSTGIPYTDFLGAEAITISTTFSWSDQDNDGGPSGQGIICNGSSANGHQLELNINGNGNRKINLLWVDGSTPGSPNMQSAVFDYQTINFNVLYNITVVLHSGNVYWYLDDQLLETDEVLYTTLGYYAEVGVPDLNIGRANREYDTYLDGYIDELAIWDRDLSLDEIQSNTISMNALIGYWNFNEGSGTTLTDLSGNENDGTIYGATWVNNYANNIILSRVDTVASSDNTAILSGQTNFREQTYKISAIDTAGNESDLTNAVTTIPYGPQNTGSLVFDGDDDYVDPQALFPDVTNTFTMSMWVKPGSTHEIDNESTAGVAGNQGQRYAVWPIHASDAYGAGHSGVGISIGTNGVSVYENANGYNPPLLVHEATLDEWSHVAVVYTNKTPKLYLNGVLERTGLTSFKTVHPSAGKGDVLGSQSGGFGGGRDGSSLNYYGGWMDEIRYYDRALGVEEILAGMNSVLDHENESGLIGYWRFDDGSGLTAIDMSTSNNHGVINGASWSGELPNQIPPEIPAGITAVAGDHQVSLSWTANSEEDLGGYNLYKALDGQEFQLIYSPNKDTSDYLDLTAENGTTYHYGLLAYDLSQNESALSDTVTAQPVNAAPAIPQSSTITAGDGQVILSWRQNQEWDINSYVIYWDDETGFSIGAENQISTVAHPDTQVTVTGLTNSQAYYFLVTAKDTSSLESESTTELSGTPIDLAPAQPQEFGGTGLEEQIDLSWKPNNEWDLAGYYLYRSTVSGFTPSSTTLIATMGDIDSTYSDANISTGTLYFYVLSALDATGNESEFTAQAAIFPSASRYSILFSTTNDNYQYGKLNIGNGTLSDSIGIELWFNTDSDNDPIIYRKDGFNDDEAYWSLELENSQLHFKGLTKGGSSFDLGSTSDVTGRWVHGAVYIQDDSVRMFINGVNESAIARPIGSLSEKRFIWVGTKGNNIGPDFENQFDGSIYDLRIWATMPDPGLLSKWRWLTVPSNRS